MHRGGKKYFFYVFIFASIMKYNKPGWKKTALVEKGKIDYCEKGKNHQNKFILLETTEIVELDNEGVNIDMKQQPQNDAAHFSRSINVQS